MNAKWEKSVTGGETDVVTVINQVSKM